MRYVAILTGLLLALMASGARAEKAMQVVAAENFYGDVASQLAGPGVSVTSILTNPDQDPHMFEASPATARALSGADIVVANGVDYDPWMAKLLRASPAAGRQEIVVGALLNKRAGSNPHLWYDPATMPAFAAAFTAALDRRDPGAATDHAQRLAAFVASMKPLRDRVAELRTRFAGVPVTATEPVFGLMASAIGLVMRNERFQIAVMNDTEPRVSDVAAFENDLRGHKVQALIYNAQADDPAAKRLLGIAQKAGIPVVPVTETEPAGTRYQAWMMQTLDGLERALATQ